MTAHDDPAAVRHFYETYGWEVGASGHYRDAEAFADLRPVMRGYGRRLDRRLARLLAPAPNGLLDIGCGGEPFRIATDGTSRRVCLDVTSAALRGARQSLGARAEYVQADVGRLPFPDGTFSRVLCAHVLYHLPPRRQRWALLEIHRVLAADGLAAIIYAQPPTPLSRLAERRHPRVEAAPERPPLPYHPVGYRELCRDLAGRMSIEVRTFSMLEPDLTRAAVPGNVLGRVALALASTAEAMLPKATLRLARYPMILIRKNP